MSRLFSLLSRLLVGIALAMPACACASDATRSPERLSRCFQLYQLWARYETANCPNQTGQRAQAEWALSRCQVGDFDRGFAELEKLLRRDLISIPTAASDLAYALARHSWIAKRSSPCGPTAR